MIRGKTKFVIAGCLTLAFAVVFCGGTAAYLMHSAAAANTFVVGSQTSAVAEVWDPPAGLKKGENYVKEVRVENTDTVDCFVRVFAEFADPVMADSVTVDWNTGDWTTKQDDGYYYYRKVLPAGGKTEPLFTTISASSDLTSLEMTVYEESVQSAGSASPHDAFGT